MAPRHLSLLSHPLFDGPLTVSELTERLQVAPTTVSPLVSELAGKGALRRREDEADRRRHIIEGTWHPSSSGSPPAHAPGQRALKPLTPPQWATFVSTLRAYEQAVAETDPRHDAVPKPGSLNRIR